MHLKGFSSIINILLVLFLYIILTVLSLSSHFLVTYLSLEAITFIMSALFVHNSKYDPTAELVLKYFTLSIFGTIFFLVGIGLVYLENKTLSYSDLKYFLNDFTFFDINNSFTKLSVIFILIGFLFKLNCAVFHF
jgi:NADH:ubiquinone oxidoreductase subunit 2 (subunit N)